MSNRTVYMSDTNEDRAFELEDESEEITQNVDRRQGNGKYNR